MGLFRDIQLALDRDTARRKQLRGEDASAEEFRIILLERHDQLERDRALEAKEEEQRRIQREEQRREHEERLREREREEQDRQESLEEDRRLWLEITGRADELSRLESLADQALPFRMLWETRCDADLAACICQAAVHVFEARTYAAQHNFQTHRLDEVEQRMRDLESALGLPQFHTLVPIILTLSLCIRRLREQRAVLAILDRLLSTAPVYEGYRTPRRLRDLPVLQLSARHLQDFDSAATAAHDALHAALRAGVLVREGHNCIEWCAGAMADLAEALAEGQGHGALLEDVQTVQNPDDVAQLVQSVEQRLAQWASAEMTAWERWQVAERDRQCNLFEQVEFDRASVVTLAAAQAHRFQDWEGHETWQRVLRAETSTKCRRFVLTTAVFAVVLIVCLVLGVSDDAGLPWRSIAVAFIASTLFTRLGDAVRRHRLNELVQGLKQARVG